MSAKNNFSSRFIAFSIGAFFGIPAFAVPLDREIHRVKLDLSNFFDLSIFEDSNDVNYYYVAPTLGSLVRNNGMPALSYADAVRDGQKFAVLNAVFQFGNNQDRINKFKTAIREQNPNAKMGPLPMSQTTPSIAVAGVGPDTCYEAEDFITGKIIKQCINLTYKSLIALNGPSNGEQLATSLVLSPAGAEILPKLLAGGSGLMVNLAYTYRAALPAIKATIEADYKKLYESYAVYAGFHDGVCTDVAVSDFWEKTLACTENGKDLLENACSIKVTYTDSQGNQLNNLFDILPNANDTESTKAWYAQNAQRVNALWTSIDGLRKDFEKRFLEPVSGRKAEVDKKPTLGFAFRADRSRTAEMGTYRFERDMLGSIGSKLSTVPAYTTCIQVDGSTGAVSNSNLGQCPEYYGGQVTAAQLVPIVNEFNKGPNKENGKIGPIDWN